MNKPMFAEDAFPSSIEMLDNIRRIHGEPYIYALQVMLNTATLVVGASTIIDAEPTEEKINSMSGLTSDVFIANITLLSFLVIGEVSKEDRMKWIAEFNINLEQLTFILYPKMRTVKTPSGD